VLKIIPQNFDRKSEIYFSWIAFFASITTLFACIFIAVELVLEGSPNEPVINGTEKRLLKSASALATNNLTQNQGLSKIRKFNKKNIFFQIIFFFQKRGEKPFKSTNVKKYSRYL